MMNEPEVRGIDCKHCGNVHSQFHDCRKAPVPPSKKGWGPKLKAGTPAPPPPVNTVEFRGVQIKDAVIQPNADSWGAGIKADGIRAHRQILAEISKENMTDLENVFSYHAPTPEQANAYNELRFAAKMFALTIERLCPASADKSDAMRKVREAVMTANASIALNPPKV